MTNFKCIILDTETTGGSNKDQIIELAYVPLPALLDFKQLSLLETGCGGQIIAWERFRPSVSIHIEAFKVHGISFQDLLHCKRTSEEAKLEVKTEYLLGHNINFDWRFLGKPEVKLICTLQLSKLVAKFDPSYKPPKHSLDELCLYLTENINPETLPFKFQNFHDAENDIKKNLFVLQKLLTHLPSIQAWDDLYIFLQEMKSSK